METNVRVGFDMGTPVRGYTPSLTITLDRKFINDEIDDPHHGLLLLLSPWRGDFTWAFSGNGN
jgi:hypothetical protein